MEARALGEGRFAWDVRDGWQQGRGMFGGTVIGAMVRAVERAVADPERRVRSVTAQLPGPTLVGPSEISVETLRTGSGQTTATARVLSGGGLTAFATVVLAKDRAVEAESFVDLEPPGPSNGLAPWRDTPRIAMEDGGPTFSRHFEFRTAGPFPFSGAESARALGWIRPAVPGRTDAALVVALCDAWWPASIVRFSGFRPIGTIAFTLQIVGAAPDLRESPLAYRAAVWAQREGWIVEQRELWSERGELVALNQQTIAIIK